MTRLALKEDHTSTGGRVLGGSSDYYAEDGRPFALDGDKATCGNCKGLWPILGSAHDWMDQGRSMVKDLDPIHCSCGKNRVFASGNSPFDYETGGSSNLIQQSTLADTSDELDHYFEIVDAATGIPVEGMTYKLLSDGVLLVDSESLVAGKTMVFSMNDHPNLSPIAWRTGDVR
jgi:uncharacterized Zn-binding protein involved in type VI secretion